MRKPDHISAAILIAMGVILGGLVLYGLVTYL